MIDDGRELLVIECVGERIRSREVGFSSGVASLSSSPPSSLSTSESESSSSPTAKAPSSGT